MKKEKRQAYKIRYLSKIQNKRLKTLLFAHSRRMVGGFTLGDRLGLEYYEDDKASIEFDSKTGEPVCKFADGDSAISYLEEIRRRCSR